MCNQGHLRPLTLAPVLGAAVLSILTSAAGAAEAPACPAGIDVVETPVAVPPGFHAFINGDPPAQPKGAPVAHRLASIMFSDGPPDQMAWLAPSVGGKRAQRWDFGGQPRAVAWLSCGFLATSIIVAAPLPAGTRSCTVAYDPATSPPAATGFTCR